MNTDTTNAQPQPMNQLFIDNKRKDVITMQPVPGAKGAANPLYLVTYRDQDGTEHRRQVPLISQDHEHFESLKVSGCLVAHQIVVEIDEDAMIGELVIEGDELVQQFNELTATIRSEYKGARFKVRTPRGLVILMNLDGMVLGVDVHGQVDISKRDILREMCNGFNAARLSQIVPHSPVEPEDGTTQSASTDDEVLTGQII